LPHAQEGNLVAHAPPVSNVVDLSVYPQR
jgi:hypothetical protein